jgi:hypothetical protein
MGIPVTSIHIIKIYIHLGSGSCIQYNILAGQNKSRR